jgi:hypothetical protein
VHFCSLPGSTELSLSACLSICGDEQPQFQDKGGIMFAIRISTILTVLYSCGLSTIALTPPDVICRHDQFRPIPAIRDCFEAARQIPCAPGYSIHVSPVWPLTFRFGTCAIMVKPLDILADARLRPFTETDPLLKNVIWEFLAPLVTDTINRCFRLHVGNNVGYTIMNGLHEGTSCKYLVVVAGTSPPNPRQAGHGQANPGQANLGPAGRGRLGL